MKTQIQVSHKTRKIVFLFLLCSFLLFLLTIPAEAYIVHSGTCGENLTWTLNDSGTLTISGTGRMTDYSYDSRIPWYSYNSSIRSVFISNNVTSIGNCSFHHCKSLTSVTISSSVTSIGDYAFNWCTHLTSVTIPNSVTDIGESAFSYCDGLTVINIPDSVTSIGFQAFEYCTNLTSVTISSSVTSTGEEAFSNCTHLTSVTIPNGVTSIDNRSFYSCSRLTDVIIPGSVTKIGSQAFSACSRLTSITIPDSVTSIGNCAFQFCGSLTTITLPCIIDIDDCAIPNDTQKIIHHKYLTEDVGFEATCEMPGLTVGSHCEECGAIVEEQQEINAFGHDWMTPTYTWSTDNTTATASHVCCRDASHIETETVNITTTITLPATCYEMGQSTYTATFSNPAFAIQTKTLTDVPATGHQWGVPTYTWSSDNTYITAKRVCDHDSSHVETEIVNVTATVTKPATNTEWGETTYASSAYTNSAFSVQTKTLNDIHPLEWEIEKDDSSVTIIKYYGEASSISIPSSLDGLPVRSLGFEAFSNCDQVTSIFIPASVKSISVSFIDCNNLNTITVNKNNAEFLSVDGILFNKNKTQLLCYPAGKSRETYAIPGSVTEIATAAFWKCSDLKNITFQNNNSIHIGSFSFAGCSGLKNITFNATDIAIGQYAFFGCDQLETIIYNGYEEFMYISPNFEGNDCFFEASSIFPTTLAKGKSGGTNSNIQWTLHTNGYLTIIGDGTMSNTPWSEYNSEIVSVYIMEGIANINDMAFANCTNLVNVSIPNSVTSIGWGAFQNCSNLTTINIPENLSSIDENVFYGCSSLKKTITIPDSVTSIASRAFGQCSSLTGIMIPDSVTSIGSNPFPTTTKVYCNEYSYAYYWAKDNRYTTVVVDNGQLSNIMTVTMPSTRTVMLGSIIDMEETVFPITEDVNITWTSSNEDVAVIINDDGLLLGQNTGTATITLSAGGKTAKCVVTVVQGAESFNIEDDVYVATTKTFQVNPYNIYPNNATLELNWKTDNSVYATVSSTGLVTGKAVGETTLTVTDAISGLIRTATIHICYPVKTVSLTLKDTTVYAGLPTTATALVTTTKGQSYENKLITFSSSNTSVATVDQQGNIKTLKAGTVTIKATAANGVTASKTLTVKAIQRILSLPANLGEIENEAFAGLTAVEAIRIPEGVYYIADDAFTGTNIIILAPEGSYAANWASHHGMTVIEE